MSGKRQRINRGELANKLACGFPEEIPSNARWLNDAAGLVIEGGAFLRLEAAKGPAKRKPVTLAKVSIQKKPRS